jgi:hypothetical protein
MSSLGTASVGVAGYTSHSLSSLDPGRFRNISDGQVHKTLAEVLLRRLQAAL